MNVTVYGKPLCVQCDATKRSLNSQRIEFDYIDVSEDPDALAKIKAMGYLQVPVVVAGEERWSGFRPDKLKALSPGGDRAQLGSLDRAPARMRL